MIKITIEGFEWDKDPDGKSNYNLQAVHRRSCLDLTFDDSQRLNTEEAVNIVRSVLFPGWLNTDPIMLPSPSFPDNEPRVWQWKKSSIDKLKDKLIEWRDACLKYEQEHRENHNGQAAEYHRGGTEAFNRVLNELLS